MSYDAGQPEKPETKTTLSISFFNLEHSMESYTISEQQFYQPFTQLLEIFWGTCTVNAKIIHKSWNKILYFSWTRTARRQIYGNLGWAFMTSDYWRFSLDHKLIGRMLNFSQALFALWHSSTEQPEQNTNVNKQPFYAPWILSETRKLGFVTMFDELQCTQFTTGDCLHFILCVLLTWFQWDLYVKTF